MVVDYVRCYPIHVINIDGSIDLRFKRLRNNFDNNQIDGQVEAAYDEKKGKIRNLDYIDNGSAVLTPAILRI